MRVTQGKRGHVSMRNEKNQAFKGTLYLAVRRAHRGRPLGKALRAIERNRCTVVKLIASRHLRQVRSGRNPTSVERNSIMDALSILTIVRESLSVSLDERRRDSASRRGARLITRRCLISCWPEYQIPPPRRPSSPHLLARIPRSHRVVYVSDSQSGSAIQHPAIIRIAKYSDNRPMLQRLACERILRDADICHLYPRATECFFFQQILWNSESICS